MYKGEVRRGRKQRGEMEGGGQKESEAYRKHEVVHSTA